jgi:flagellar biosynthetic protein FliR
MTTIDLAPYYGYLPALMRFTGVVLTAPLLGDNFVRFRWRIMLALALTVTLGEPSPAIEGALPGRILAGLAQGLLVGGIARLIVTSVQILGAVISNVIGLQFASLINPGEGQQAGVIDVFFAFLALKFYLLTGMLHQLLLLPEDLLSRGGAQGLADGMELMVDMYSAAIRLGVLLATPFIVFNLLLLVALGIANRFMPTFPMFMLFQPVQIVVGLAAIAIFINAEAFYALYDHFRAQFSFLP